MGWERWFSGSHHGKTRTTKSGGGSKTEGFVGKNGGSFFSHFSISTKPSGRKSAHVGPHKDKK